MCSFYSNAQASPSVSANPFGRASANSAGRQSRDTTDRRIYPTQTETPPRHNNGGGYLQSPVTPSEVPRPSPANPFGRGSNASNVSNALNGGSNNSNSNSNNVYALKQPPTSLQSNNSNNSSNGNKFSRLPIGSAASAEIIDDDDITPRTQLSMLRKVKGDAESRQSANSSVSSVKSSRDSGGSSARDRPQPLSAGPGGRRPSNNNIVSPSLQRPVGQQRSQAFMEDYEQPERDTVDKRSPRVSSAGSTGSTSGRLINNGLNIVSKSSKLDAYSHEDTIDAYVTSSSKSEPDEYAIPTTRRPSLNSNNSSPPTRRPSYTGVSSSMSPSGSASSSQQPRQSNRQSHAQLPGNQNAPQPTYSTSSSTPTLGTVENKWRCLNPQCRQYNVNPTYCDYCAIVRGATGKKGHGAAIPYSANVPR